MSAKHTIDKLDLAMARRVANAHGPRGDSDLESAAMKGLLEAATSWHGDGMWRTYAYGRIVRRVQDELRAKIARTYQVPLDLIDETIPIADATNVIDLLADVPLAPDVRADLEAGLIDLRRNDHRNAIATLKESQP